MSAKISAARRAAFFKALCETGNITLSAERARVSRSWVQLHRSSDPGFDAACREALRQAQDRLKGSLDFARDERREEEGSGIPDQVRDDEGGGDGRGVKPAGRWAYQGGEELVIRGSNGRRAQVSRARLKQWTARAEERFLVELGATANVKMACAAVGLTAQSAYGHRRRWQDFARRWDEVIDEAMVTLDIALLERALTFMDGQEAPVGTPIREMTVGDALYISEMYRRRREGHPKQWGRQRRGPPSLDSVRASIERKVRAIMAMRDREEPGG